MAAFLKRKLPKIFRQLPKIFSYKKFSIIIDKLMVIFVQKPQTP